MSIKIKKVSESRVSTIDFDNLPFGRICTDHMYVVDYENGAWGAPEITPLSYFQIHPANLAWHYGQSIFEGMKASKHIDGTPMLFRVRDHAKRMNASARRMCMPEIPEDMFVDAVSELVKLEQNWIPPQEGSALYIRPFLFATEEYIGVRPSTQYKFVIFTCPVGPYYSHPVSLRVESEYIRAAPGGVGAAKTAGNYAASLYPTELAITAGFDQVMWMGGKKFQYVQEVGTMNIFFVLDNKIYTPELNGCILDGITRNSVIKILESEGYIVVEQPISIKKVFKSYKKGQLQEVFGSGTAAVISEIKKISFGKKVIKLSPDQYKIAPALKQKLNGIRMGTTEDSFGWTSPLK